MIDSPTPRVETISCEDPPTTESEARESRRGMTTTDSAPADSAWTLLLMVMVMDSSPAGWASSSPEQLASSMVSHSEPRSRK